MNSNNHDFIGTGATTRGELYKLLNKQRPAITAALSKMSIKDTHADVKTVDSSKAYANTDAVQKPLDKSAEAEMVKLANATADSNK